jgi:SAM-dependent methyltransferase
MKSNPALSFDEDAALYDRCRPRYCGALFAAIARYAALSGASRAVEIGCGTGQATEGILKTGCAVLAAEPGGNLAAVARRKFAAWQGFQVQNIPFEVLSYPPGTADLVFSATAFHWVPEDVGYPKAYALLRRGGTLALFWNRPFVARRDDALHQKIQSVYPYIIDTSARGRAKPRRTTRRAPARLRKRLKNTDLRT